MSLKPYFCIVGRGDVPIFETSFGANAALTSAAAAGSASAAGSAGAVGSSSSSAAGAAGAAGSGKDDLIQLVLHAALDVVEQRLLSSSSMLVRHADRFNDRHVSAFVTAAGARMLLLHEATDEAALKAFFSDAHELYVKAVMSPFAEPNAPLLCAAAMEAKLIESARKHGLRV